MTLNSKPNAAEPDRQLGRTSFLIFIALFTFTFALFSTSLHGRFVRWDDDINITQNPNVQGIDGARLAWMFTDLQQALRYKPLSWLTWAALYEVGGLNPAIFHLGNVLFHSLNVGLLFLLITKILRLGSTGSSDKRLGMSVAAVAALLWAIHPLRVEPVGWITGLPYCQSLFLLLLSVFCYLQSHLGMQSDRPHRGWYWGSVVFFGLALLSYPVVIGAGAIFLLIDVCPLRRIEVRSLWRGAVARRIWMEKVPYFLFAAGFVLLALWARVNASGTWSRPLTLAEFGPASRIAQAFYVWSYFLWKPLAPLNLSPVYTTLLKFSPTDWPFVLSTAIVVGVTLLLVWQRKRWPAAFILWLCHLCVLVPVLGLTEHPHYPSDRYCYIASVVWFMALAVALMFLVKRPVYRRPVWISCAGLATAFALTSLQQIHVWQNTDTLFKHMIAKIDSPLWRAHLQTRWGTLLAGEERFDEAAVQLSAALEAVPGRAGLHQRLADILAAQNKHSEAARHYAEAARLQGAAATRNPQTETAAAPTPSTE
jgi:hypothetical protein